jgi:cytochrome c553
MSTGNREIHMKSRIAAAVVAAGFALAANAADVEQGRAKSLACQACHGSAGIGTAADIPNLAGQKAPYLKAQLIAFRGGDRKHELMNAIAKQLSDDEIENLAVFWSSLPVAGAAADAHASADPAAECLRGAAAPIRLAAAGADAAAEGLRQRDVHELGLAVVQRRAAAGGADPGKDRRPGDRLPELLVGPHAVLRRRLAGGDRDVRGQGFGGSTVRPARVWAPARIAAARWGAGAAAMASGRRPSTVTSTTCRTGASAAQLPAATSARTAGMKYRTDRLRMRALLQTTRGLGGAPARPEEAC